MLSYAARGVIYDCNMFVIQVTVTMVVNYDHYTFIVKANGVNPTNFFSLSLTKRTNKLGCLSLTSLQSLVFYFQARLVDYSKGKNYLRLVPALLANIRLG
jgi:hypothetical protein